MRRLRYVLVAVTSVMVWLGWLIWPLGATTGLDPSWQLVLGYAKARGLQFGTDFVFTHGPWSFLNVEHCYAPMFWQAIVWQLFFKALVASAVGFFVFEFPLWRGLLLLLAATLLLPLFEDVAPELLIIFMFWRIAGTKRLPLFALLAAAALLGFMALQKFTFCVMIAVAAGGATTLLFSRRQPRDAIAFAVTVTGSLAIFWLAAGQQIVHLPTYLYRSWQLASDYSEAMFIDESALVFWCGITTAIVAAGTLFIAINRDRSWPRTTRLLVGALAFFFAFVIWKQGFVRADGHVRVFFLCALGVGLVLQPATSGLALAAIASVGFAVSNSDLFFRAPALFQLRLTASLAALSSPGALHTRFQADTAAGARAAALPKIREQAGGKSCDVFGDDHSAALLNGLSYRSRPVFQTHQAYSAPLAELNARFYASPNAPEHVLARLQTIDGRFLPADDARSLAMLLQDYRSVVMENGWRLLRRERVSPPPSWTPLCADELKFGTPIRVPERMNALVWAQIDVRPTPLGRLRTFFYKAAEVTLVVHDGIGARRYRLIVPAARGGFLVAPLLRDADDYSDFLEGSGKRAAKSLMVDVTPSAQKYYKRKVSVKFATSPLRPAF